MRKMTFAFACFVAVSSSVVPAIAADFIQQSGHVAHTRSHHVASYVQRQTQICGDMHVDNRVENVSETVTICAPPSFYEQNPANHGQPQ